MNKAYALLNVKAIDQRADEWVIEGIASTPVPDRMGDIVEPMGAKFKLPMPLLLRHDHQAPVGRVEFARPTKTGIPYRAHLPKVAEAGRLKDRVDEAIQSIRHRLVGAVSIGFAPVADAMERLKDGGWRFKEWEWLELSLVTIPANPEATITGLKSFDAQVRAAIGNRAPGVASPAAAGHATAAKAATPYRSPKGNTMKTIQEQLAELQETRAHKQARAKELTELANAESRSLHDDEGAEVDELVSDIKALDNQIRVKSVEAMSAASARAIDTSNYGKSASRGPTILVRKQDKDEDFPGQNFTRKVIAKAVARIEDRSPIAVAEQRWAKSNPRLVAIIKADVAGGGTGSGEWGAELADSDTKYTGDFIEYLHGMTLFDRLPLRAVPSRVHIKGQDGAATGYWVGESKAVPATAMDFSDVELTPLKVGALAVVSNELLMDSSPSAEMLVRDALAEANSQRVDTTFLSTTAASAGVSPAGLLNGLTANTSGGATADDVREDLAGLLKYFSDLKYNISGLILVTTPTVAMQLYMLRNALGQREFSDVTMGGGTLDGVPLFTGHNVGSGDLIMMSPRDIYKIGDGGIQVSISREATIEQNDAPAGATDTPVTMAVKNTSMFQSESTAIKVVRRINFAKRRSTAVAYIGNAAYGTITSV